MLSKPLLDSGGESLLTDFSSYAVHQWKGRHITSSLIEKKSGLEPSKPDSNKKPVLSFNLERTCNVY